jgi:hypothetical protein
MPQVADAAIKASRSLKTPQYRTRAPPRVGGWRWASSPQLPDNRCSSLPSAAHTRKQGGRAHAQLRGTGYQVNDTAETLNPYTRGVPASLRIISMPRVAPGALTPQEGQAP